MKNIINKTILKHEIEKLNVISNYCHLLLLPFDLLFEHSRTIKKTSLNLTSTSNNSRIIHTNQTKNCKQINLCVSSLLLCEVWYCTFYWHYFLFVVLFFFLFSDNQKTMVKCSILVLLNIFNQPEKH